MAFTVVKAPLANGREIGLTSFADLTPMPCVAVQNGWFNPSTGSVVCRVIFQGDARLDTAVIRRIMLRLGTANADEETLKFAVAQAYYAANPTVLLERILRLEQTVNALSAIALGVPVASSDDAAT